MSKKKIEAVSWHFAVGVQSPECDEWVGALAKQLGGKEPPRPDWIHNHDKYDFYDAASAKEFSNAVRERGDINISSSVTMREGNELVNYDRYSLCLKSNMHRQIAQEVLVDAGFQCFVLEWRLFDFVFVVYDPSIEESLIAAISQIEGAVFLNRGYNEYWMPGVSLWENDQLAPRYKAPVFQGKFFEFRV